MNAHLQTAFAPAPQLELVAWHELRAAQNILRNIDALNAPICTVTFRQGLRVDGHVAEYDRDDARVIALIAIANAWFEMAEAYVPIALSADIPTVDEQISAAVDAAIKRDAALDRVSAYLNEGFTLGEARRMANTIDFVAEGEA